MQHPLMDTNVLINFIQLVPSFVIHDYLQSLCWYDKWYESVTSHLISEIKSSFKS